MPSSSIERHGVLVDARRTPLAARSSAALSLRSTSEDGSVRVSATRRATWRLACACGDGGFDAAPAGLAGSAIRRSASPTGARRRVDMPKLYACSDPIAMSGQSQVSLR